MPSRRSADPHERRSLRVSFCNSAPSAVLSSMWRLCFRRVDTPKACLSKMPITVRVLDVLAFEQAWRRASLKAGVWGVPSQICLHLVVAKVLLEGWNKFFERKSANACTGSSSNNGSSNSCSSSSGSGRSRSRVVVVLDAPNSLVAVKGQPHRCNVDRKTSKPSLSSSWGSQTPSVHEVNFQSQQLTK